MHHISRVHNVCERDSRKSNDYPLSYIARNNNFQVSHSTKGVPSDAANDGFSCVIRSHNLKVVSGIEGTRSRCDASFRGLELSPPQTFYIVKTNKMTYGRKYGIIILNTSFLFFLRNK